MVGGLETVVELLSREFAAAGHEVTVITNALKDEPDEFPFQVLRRPSLATQIRVIQSSDVFLHANVSLWGLIPWILAGPSRPVWVATHHGWYSHHNRSRGPLDQLKVFLAKTWAVNISVSHAINEQLRLRGHVVSNPYNDTLFRILPGVEKTRDIVFLGRFVSDKGADLLLSAVGELRENNLNPTVTLVGSGPELDSLVRQTRSLGLISQVTFDGIRKGEDLVRRLNEHRILVAPSRWNEPFGLIALEAIACGCVVIGSSGGGLPEAIGPCGTTFPNEDTGALAAALRQALHDPSRYSSNYHIAHSHLAAHSQSSVAALYLHTLTSS